MLNDTEESGEELRINLNETLICLNMRYVYLLLYEKQEHINIKINKTLVFNFLTLQ